MHAKVQEGDNKQETTRGASLRELQRFFKEHDTDKGYAGLRRIPDEDGTAVWTILNETEVAAQLEKRVNERREEERREEERPSSEATPELERLKAENANQKQQLNNAQLLINAHQNQEATPELERLKAENEDQKQQLVDAQNQNQLLINAHQNKETGACCLWGLLPLFGRAGSSQRD